MICYYWKTQCGGKPGSAAVPIISHHLAYRTQDQTTAQQCPPMGRGEGELGKGSCCLMELLSLQCDASQITLSKQQKLLHFVFDHSDNHLQTQHCYNQNQVGPVRHAVCLFTAQQFYSMVTEALNVRVADVMSVSKLHSRKPPNLKSPVVYMHSTYTQYCIYNTAFTALEKSSSLLTLLTQTAQSADIFSCTVMQVLRSHTTVDRVSWRFHFLEYRRRQSNDRRLLTVILTQSNQIAASVDDTRHTDA